MARPFLDQVLFIGHFAVAFAAKKAVPRVSLGTLFISVQFLDLLWPLLLLADIEHVRIDPGNTVVTPFDFYDYPFSHSLVGALGWAAIFSLGYFAVRGNRIGAGILAIGVASHWVLDVITHRPDLPVLPNGPYVGLGLWNSPAGTMVVELALFAAGVFLYVGSDEGIEPNWFLRFVGLDRVSCRSLAGEHLRRTPSQRHRRRGCHQLSVAAGRLGVLDRPASESLKQTAKDISPGSGI